MSQTNALPPPGWYPDPWSAPTTRASRWWDGNQWTPHAGAAAVQNNGMSPQGVPLASQWARLGARIIDAVLLGVLTVVPVLAIGWALFSDVVRQWIDIESDSGLTTEEMSRRSDLLWQDNGAKVLLFYVVAGGALLVIQIGYEAILTHRYGQTLGKKLLGIKVVRVQDGRNQSFGGALGRVAMRIVLSNIYVDDLWCLWDKPWRQCLHDKVVKTVVVKA